MRIEANSMHIDRVHTSPCLMCIQWNQFESGLIPIHFAMRVARMRPNAQLRITCTDRNTNMLFNVHFNHQLIGAKPLLCLVVWTRSMCTECKLNAVWSIQFVNWFESSSSVDRSLDTNNCSCLKPVALQTSNCVYKTNLLVSISLNHAKSFW